MTGMVAICGKEKSFGLVGILLFAITFLLISGCRMQGFIHNPRDGSKQKTIGEALKAANPGDTLIIHKGTYYTQEDTWIESDLTILGKGEPEIICRNMESNVLWISSYANVTLKGLRLRHSDPRSGSNCLGNVIGISSGGEVRVEDCDINGCGKIGIYISGFGKLILRNNRIHNNSVCAFQVEGNARVDYFEETDTIPNLVMEGNKIWNNGPDRQPE